MAQPAATSKIFVAIVTVKSTFFDPMNIQVFCEIYEIRNNAIDHSDVGAPFCGYIVQMWKPWLESK